MNWIQQNKFLAGIAAVALLGVMLLGWLSFSTLSDASASIDTYKKTADELSRLYNGKLYPNDANLKQERELVAAMKKETAGLRETLAKQYGVDPNPQDASTFGQRVQRRYEEFGKLREEHGTKVPEDFFLGLQRYREKVAAPKEAVRNLDHQLSAIAHAMEIVAKSGVSEILYFERALVTGEEGAPVKEEAKGKGKGAATGPTPITRYPMELHVQGSEASIRALVNALAASKQYFYAFRAMRMQNEAQVGPLRENVRDQVKPAPVAGATDNLFAGMGTEAAAAPAFGASEATPAAAPAATPAVGAVEAASLPAATTGSFAQPGGKDAYFFLGGEQVKAVLQFDLVIFEASPTATPDTGGAAKKK